MIAWLVACLIGIEAEWRYNVCPAHIFCHGEDSPALSRSQVWPVNGERSVHAVLVICLWKACLGTVSLE